MTSAAKLTKKQTDALALIRERSSAQVTAGEPTWADKWTAFVHWRTAYALESQGAIAIAFDGDITIPRGN